MQISERASSAIMQNDEMRCSDYCAAMQNDSAIAYIREVLERTGWSSAELARRASIAPSTLSRPLNSENWATKVSRTTIEKVAKASGINPPWFGAPSTGFPVDSVQMPDQPILERAEVGISENEQGTPDALMLEAHLVGGAGIAIAMTPEQAAFLKDEIEAALALRRSRLREVL